MKLPTLYCRTSTGDVQEWTIEVKNDSYRTHSGKKDGKIIISAWKECTAKNSGKTNATTDLEQAKVEAKAKWDKKKKEKYHESIEDIDCSAYFHPMLAKDTKDRWDKIDYPILIEPKLNGGRMIARADGLFTRKGEPIECVPHIWEAIEPLFKKHPHLILDGECYTHEYRDKLNEMMRIFRTSKKHCTPELLEESKNLVQYHLYDAINYTQVDYGEVAAHTIQSIRKNALQYFIKNIPYLQYVKSKVARNREEIDKIYKEYLELNYEGAILRDPLGCYENKRSKYLLKMKPYEDNEFEIVDVLTGEGKFSNIAATIVLKMEDGRTFEAQPKNCSLEECGDILKKKKDYIGKTATIQYNGLTGKGLPNFAKFDFKNWVKENR